MSPLRLLAIALGVLVWFASLGAVPWCTQKVAVYLWGPDAAILGGAGGFLVVLVGTLVGILAGIARSERAELERVRREGVRCMALIKSFRRVSMTQHRVLFVLQLPTGLAGREYVLTDLDDGWLANVCALEQPVRVIAHPTANTLIVEG